jgi:Predicted membrane protein
LFPQEQADGYQGGILEGASGSLARQRSESGGVLPATGRESSSIHLLATFIKARSMDGDTIMWQILLHLTFVISAVALAYIDKLTQPAGRHAGAH